MELRNHFSFTAKNEGFGHCTIHIRSFELEFLKTRRVPVA